MATLPAGGSGVNPPGTTAPPARFMYTVGFLGIQPVTNEIPKSFMLYNNYPNPFNPMTKIRFDLPADGSTKVTVYDISGREVSVPLNEYLKAGEYEIKFDALNLSSGIYFYRLTSGNFNSIKKMVLLK
jgi:hypothetical protein